VDVEYLRGQVLRLLSQEVVVGGLMEFGARHWLQSRNQLQLDQENLGTPTMGVFLGTGTIPTINYTSSGESGWHVLWRCYSDYTLRVLHRISGEMRRL